MKAIAAILPVLLVLFGASKTIAFVPNSSTILARVAKSAGKGMYVVEQEVSFRTAADPVVVREHWLIESSESMRVTVNSQKGATEPFLYNIIYRDGRRWAPEAGQLKSGAQSSEFLEGLIYARSSKSIANILMRAKVLPPSFFRERTRAITSTGVKYEPEPGVRLARFAGVVNYFFGLPTPAASETLNPGVWIEQDSFFVRKIRTPSQSEMLMDKPSVSGGLRLARERIFNWDTNSVGVRVLSVRSAPGASAGQINPNSLSSTELRNQKLPETPQVQEFYKRFR